MERRLRRMRRALWAAAGVLALNSVLMLLLLGGSASPDGGPAAPAQGSTASGGPAANS